MQEQIVQRNITVKAPPASVWEAVRDFGGHGKWLPGAEQSAGYVTWSGDPNTPGTERRFAAPGHPVFAERLNRIDEEAFEVAYSIVEAPLEISDHEATITVQPDPDGAAVVWKARFWAEDTTAAQMDDFMGTDNFEPGLAGLKRFVEDG